MFLQVWRDHRQHGVHSLEQMHADLAEIEMMEFLLQHLDELCERAGLLNTRRTATDHDERQHAFALFRIDEFLVSTLEHMQHMVADMRSLSQCLHAEGVLLHILHAEEIRRRTGGQNDIIVRYLTVVRQHHMPLGIHALRLGHEEFHIGIIAEERTNRIRYLVLREDGRRNLIQQRLEQMKIVPVDNGDLHILPGELLRQSNAAKTGTDDYDTGLLVCHDKNPPCSP